MNLPARMLTTPKTADRTRAQAPYFGRPAAPLPTPAVEPPIPGPKAVVGATPGRRPPSMALVLTFVLGLIGVSLYYWGYYGAEQSERVRHPLHSWLRPSGYLGQSAGILAVSIFFFLWLYPLRKKVRWLAWTGTMAKWLDVHIATALTLPVLTAVHASWRFDGVIGLGYWSMIVVCLSGVVGRYLYVKIPRSASGLELTADEIAAERRQLLEALAQGTKLPVPQVEALLRSDPTPCDGLGVLATGKRMVSDEVMRWRAARALRRLCQDNRVGHRLDRKTLRRVARLARQEMALTQQVRMLGATHRVFRLWHVAHRPFALVALVAVLIHVGVVVGMGMTWFW